jgi:hypothetical protein
MALTTYAELVTAVGSWLNRSDLDSMIPDFIALFEARMNRVLRHPEMESTATSAIAEGDTELSLPDDFLAARTIYLDDDPDNVLVAMSPMNLRACYPYENGGELAAYAIQGSTIQLAPSATAAGTLTLSYYQKIPALDDTNTTNWLLDSHPDAYLFGTLTQAQVYLQDDQRAGMWKAAWDEIWAEINDAGDQRRVPAGPLTMRPAVSE